ncbi:pilus assembly protein TadG-related protein [Glycomyces sp. NPDC047369]
MTDALLLDSSPRSGLGPRRRDGGFATPFALAMLFAFFAAVGLSFDGGGAVAAKVRAATAAAESARAGANEIDIAYFRQSGIVRLNPPAAEAAASAWLAATGMSGSVTATFADVTVTAATTHNTQILSAFGLSTFNVTATATAEPDQGDTPTALDHPAVHERNGP